MTAPSETARAWVDVDLDALVANARTLAAACGTPLLPMVKANGYGLGATRVALALEALDPWGYGVATPWAPIFLIVPAVICISALPVTPNGLGVRDNLYLYLLSLPEIGTSAGTAVSISLVAYAASLVWSAVGGALYIALRRERDLQEAISEKATEEEWPAEDAAP